MPSQDRVTRKPKDQPNILLIITDQQHWRMMSCAGNQYLHTPAMDSLAKNGVRFDRTYCTNPTCVPSRMSMFMGLMPSQMDMISNPSEQSNLTDETRRNALGWLMQYAGYDVGYAGKVHLGINNTLADLGFPNWLTWDDRDECAAVSADFIMKERDKPFFLVTSLINPHDICLMGMRDYTGMKNYPREERVYHFVEKGGTSLKEVDRALVRPEGVSESEFWDTVCPPLPANAEIDTNEPEAMELHVNSSPCLRAIRETWDEKKWRLYRYAYARLTERVDGQIAAVLDALRETGQDENTIVVFTSDHGDNDSARRMVQKHLPYDESIRVPFIISHRGMSRAGEVDHRLVCNGLDIIPTLCDYAGIDPPSTSRGRSVRPLVEGKQVDWRDHVVVETQISRTVLKGPWQYITFCSGKNQEQLFNLGEDPLAMCNLIDNPEYHGIVEELRKNLKYDIEEIDDRVGREMFERSPEWKGLPLERHSMCKE